MIAQKNLQYLSDILTQEKNMASKMCFYAESVKEPQLKSLIEMLKTMHEKNYDTVYTYLKSHAQ
jgi:hypothetical protein